MNGKQKSKMDPKIPTFPVVYVPSLPVSTGGTSGQGGRISLL